ncbi:hypothetical protein BN1200_1080035 [Klebsiella variicola]|nr:hypothetical protein BN1200_1080035 [Klebsiella variicola]
MSLFAMMNKNSAVKVYRIDTDRQTEDIKIKKYLMTNYLFLKVITIRNLFSKPDIPLAIMNVVI